MKPEDPKPELDLDEGASEALSMEQINELLAKEDPRFVEQLKDLGDLKAPEGVKLEPLGLEMDVLEKPARKKKRRGFMHWLTWPARTLRNFSWRRMVRKGQVLTLRSWRGSGEFFKRQTKKLSAVLLSIKHWYKGLTAAARGMLWLMFFCFMAMAGAAASLGKLDFRALIDGVEVVALNTVADEVYHFEVDEPRESFFSPMRRPEAYILLESMVIQLKPSPRAEMPKLFVEYIIEASSQRAAHEIQQNQGRLRDQISRVTESFSSEELRTTAGKVRLKDAVKKVINNGIHSGYVRNVYFKKFLTN